MSLPAMPTREEIHVKAEKMYLEDRTRAGLAPITPTRTELSEGNYIVKAQRELMSGYRGTLETALSGYLEEVEKIREELEIKPELEVEKVKPAEPILVPDPFSRWSQLHEELVIGETPIDIRSWIDKRIAIPKVLTLTEEDKIKKASVYVKNGLTIHWKEDIHEPVWEVIADLLGTTAERLSDSSTKSTDSGRDKTLSFD